MPDVISETIGNAGVITLDKPETLNALSHSMVRSMSEVLREWAHEPEVRHVLIRSSGGRAFSAGGDIRDLYDRGRTHYEDVLTFFADEYRLNTLIMEYPKPYVALIDGIVMGGGVGVSVNGRYRVGTENMRFAMPEVGIGFFPDVGATFFLPRFPDRLGIYCALTGARLKQEEAAAAGVVTHTAAAGDLDNLFQMLTESDNAPALLDEVCGRAGHAASPETIDTIDTCFSQDSVEAILEALDDAAAGGDSFAGETASSIRTKSPTSLKIALRQMQVGANAHFRACMRTEYRIVSHVLQGVDFYEGVRATIVDKDNSPSWQPKSLSAVTDGDVDRYFEAPPKGDLDFNSTL